MLCYFMLFSLQYQAFYDSGHHTTSKKVTTTNTCPLTRIVFQWKSQLALRYIVRCKKISAMNKKEKEEEEKEEEEEEQQEEISLPRIHLQINETTRRLE